jgi:ribosomal protein S16
MTEQYLRKCQLVVGSASELIDLSELKIAFTVRQWDIQTPNYTIIRVFNLSDATSKKIQKEFTKVSLQAGYQDGPFGLIFIGDVKQIRRGRVDAVTTYLDILAADADMSYNFGVVNLSLKAGSTPTDHVTQIAKAMGLKVGYIDGLSTAKLPRGKVLYGMGRDHLRRIAASNAASYSIQNETLQIIPLTGYMPGEAVVLNSQTGMVGMPEQTQDGIRVQCLLNPNIKVGTRIQLNNADIQLAAKDPALQGDLSFAFLPSISSDGFYRVLVNDLEGDTRGKPWYNELICLAVNDTVTPGLAVKGYG